MNTPVFSWRVGYNLKGRSNEEGGERHLYMYGSLANLGPPPFCLPVNTPPPEAALGVLLQPNIYLGD